MNNLIGFIAILVLGTTALSAENLVISTDYYQEENLTLEHLPELNMATLKVGQTITIDNLQFSADSCAIPEESLSVLKEIYTFLKENPSVSIEISGHTNSVPPDMYCDELSSARAQSVAETIYEMGIDTVRVSHKGYGKRQPISANNTSYGRQINQRVEIKILKL